MNTAGMKSPGRTAQAIAMIAAFLTVSLASCSNDSIDQGLLLKGVQGDALLAGMAGSLAPTTGHPLPGGGAMLTVTAVTGSTINVAWTRATDDTTPAASLEYKLVISESNNIGSVLEAELNGTVAVDWTADLATAGAAGLTNGTIYYLNVLVRDTDGNVSPYSAVSAATHRDSTTLFSAGRYTGAMIAPTVPSARAALDQICRAARESLYPGMFCTDVRAFISLSNSDTIAFMPGNFAIPQAQAIRGPGGALVANSWADMLDGSIEDDLVALDVAHQEWWSGSNSAGIGVADNCGTWTGLGAGTGAAGAHNKSDGQWLYSGSRNCNDSLHLLCICR